MVVFEPFLGIRPAANLAKGTDCFLEDPVDILQSSSFIQDSAPCFYLYTIETEGHTQTGVVGCFSTADYEARLVKQHELTRSDVEETLTRDLLETGWNLCPVLLMHRPSHLLNCTVASFISQNAPVNKVRRWHDRSQRSVQHTLWRCNDPQLVASLRDAFRSIPAFYIADGHHRSASAAGASRCLQTLSPSPPPDHHLYLAVAFPTSHMRLLPFHRLLTLQGDPPSLLHTLSTTPHVSLHRLEQPPVSLSHPLANPLEFLLLLNGTWYTLRIRQPSPTPTPTSALPQAPTPTLAVDLLQDFVLLPAFGIRDPRTDPRIRFVPGDRLVSSIAESYGLVNVQSNGRSEASSPESSVDPSGEDALEGSGDSSGEDSLSLQAVSPQRLVQETDERPIGSPERSLEGSGEGEPEDGFPVEASCEHSPDAASPAVSPEASANMNSAGPTERSPKNVRKSAPLKLRRNFNLTVATDAAQWARQAPPASLTHVSAAKCLREIIPSACVARATQPDPTPTPTTSRAAALAVAPSMSCSPRVSPAPSSDKSRDSSTISGTHVIIFVPATPLGDVLAVADAGSTMPPKSTFFDPKPLGGLIMRRGACMPGQTTSAHEVLSGKCEHHHTVVMGAATTASAT